MILTFAEAVPPPKEPTPKDVERATAAVRDRVGRVTLASQSEIDALTLRDRAIEIAYGKSRGQRELIKAPDGVQLSANDIALAAWINAYAAGKEIPFKSALVEIFDYLKRHPDHLQQYIGADLNFSECGVFAPAADELPEHKAVRIGRRLSIYQAAAGCSFLEAVGAGILELDSSEVPR